MHGGGWIGGLSSRHRWHRRPWRSRTVGSGGTGALSRSSMGRRDVRATLGQSRRSACLRGTTGRRGTTRHTPYPQIPGDESATPRSPGRVGSLARLARSGIGAAAQGADNLGGFLFERTFVMRTRTRNLLLGVLAGLLATGAATESPGCTDFRIKAADGTVIIGQTMDFEVPSSPSSGSSLAASGGPATRPA
jgi:hypothetical protein